MNKTILIVTFLLLINQLIGQQLKPLNQKENFFFEYEISVPNTNSIVFDLDFPITGFVILSKQKIEPYIRVQLNGIEFALKNDDHDILKGKYENYYRSQLIDFGVDQANFVFPELNQDIVLHVFNGRKNVSPIRRSIEIDSSFCEYPKTVPQSEWRAGLPDPKPNPTYTQPEHMVIHHSAGSNIVTNATERIRNIYLLHTQTNGWDDIGYNYVIVPDGRIYMGRDGQGKVEEDFVKGAHFSAKNSNTLGICMLGTYTDTIPTDTALASLEKLISWKLFKDQLHPLAKLEHPKSGGIPLEVICGHRDGGATLCPGEKLYNLIPQIRINVLSRVDSCGGISKIEPIGENVKFVYPNPASEYVNIDVKQLIQLHLYDGFGRKVLTTCEKKIDLKNLNKGIYILHIETNENYYIKKLIVRR